MLVNTVDLPIRVVQKTFRHSTVVLHMPCKTDTRGCYFMDCLAADYAMPYSRHAQQYPQFLWFKHDVEHQQHVAAHLRQQHMDVFLH